ncbi:MAG: YbhB/YbcL family Raf kinase inhibitor-like protein, partial [Bdellovibrionales bacterium]|nr:YbhB/YbcL family Raf kinase inhibitor-like protein [Oligoflexia bacterium]
SKIGFPTNVRQGQNSKTKLGFTGPLPPFFHGYHRYFFRLFALNAPLHLAPGSNLESFVDEMDGKVIGEARLIGLYARTPASRAKGVLKMATAIGAVAGLGIYLSRRLKEKRSVRTSSGQNLTEIDNSDFATAAYVTEDLLDANFDQRAKVKPAYRVDSDDQFH